MNQPKNIFSKRLCDMINHAVTDNTVLNSVRCFVQILASINQSTTEYVGGGTEREGEREGERERERDREETYTG